VPGPDCGAAAEAAAPQRRDPGGAEEGGPARPGSRRRGCGDRRARLDEDPARRRRWRRLEGWCFRDRGHRRSGVVGELLGLRDLANLDGMRAQANHARRGRPGGGSGGRLGKGLGLIGFGRRPEGRRLVGALLGRGDLNRGKRGLCRLGRGELGVAIRMACLDLLTRDRRD
jgi:hypothetical protein